MTIETTLTLSIGAAIGVLIALGGFFIRIGSLLREHVTVLTTIAQHEKSLESLRDLPMLVAANARIVGDLVTRIERLADIPARVDLLWEFNMRRGLVALLQRGMAEERSPIVLKLSGLNAVAQVLDRIVPTYARWLREMPDVTDARLAELMERDFGDMISQEICRPYQMTEGDCLALLVLACRGRTEEIPNA